MVTISFAAHAELECVTRSKHNANPLGHQGNQVQVHCDAGYVAMGGGAECYDSGNWYGRLTKSYPLPNGWAATCHRYDTNGTSNNDGAQIVARIHVTCCRSFSSSLNDTAPDPRYLDDDEQQILIEGYVSLLVLPNREYGELQIILQNENARIAEISLALAANAHFSLPEHDYQYRFNADTGRVEIFNDSEQRVLALPVNAQGLTPWVRVGEGEETRIEVDPVTLTLIEETLPNEQPLVTIGEAPEQGFKPF